MKIEKSILKDITTAPIMIAQKNKVSINSCVRLEYKGGKLSVYASNGSQSVAFFAEAKEDGDEFDVLFAADTLKRTIEAFDKVVEITYENDKELVFREKSFVRRANTAAYDVADFFFPEPKNLSEPFVLDESQRRRLLQGAENNLANPVLSPSAALVRLYSKDSGALELSATDQHVAIMRKLPAEDGQAFPPLDVLIPPEAVRFFRGLDGDVKVMFDEREGAALPKPEGYMEGVDDPLPPAPKSHLLVLETSRARYFSTLGDGLVPLECSRVFLPADRIFSIAVFDALELFKKFAQYDYCTLFWGGELGTNIRISAATKTGECSSQIDFDVGEVLGDGYYHINPAFVVSVLSGFQEAADAEFKVARRNDGNLMLQVHSGISKAVIMGLKFD